MPPPEQVDQPDHVPFALHVRVCVPQFPHGWEVGPQVPLQLIVPLGHRQVAVGPEPEHWQPTGPDTQVLPQRVCPD